MLPSIVPLLVALVAPTPTGPGYGCAPPVIEAVEIRREDVFSESEARGLYKLVNKAHVVTREGVVRRELLFAEGDELDVEALEQSERNLRKRPFLRGIALEVLDDEGRVLATAGEESLSRLACDPRAPDTVRVRVTTRDSWSTSVEGTLKRAGDRFLWGVGVTETNFLGRGKQLELAHEVDLDRTSDVIWYSDPQIAGGSLAGEIRYKDQSDGSRLAFAVGRPMRSLDTRWGWKLDLETFDQLQPLYFRGDRDREPRHVRRRQELQVTRLVGRSGQTAYRVHAGYRSWFDSVDDEARDFGIFRVGVSRVEHGYRKLTHVNHERPEDVNLGAVSGLFLGVSPPGPAASDGGWFFDASHSQGLTLGSDGILLGDLEWAGRVRGGRLENSLGEVGLTYLGPGDHELLYLSARYRRGSRLDPELQLTLGAQNGLRGYPVHQFTGDSTLLLTAEHRWFVADDLFRLLSLGVTAFADTGLVWRGPRGGTTDGFRSDVGVGLLIGRKRSSLRKAAMRIDLAYALDPVPGRGRWLVSFTPVDTDF